MSTRVLPAEGGDVGPSNEDTIDHAQAQHLAALVF